MSVKEGGGEGSNRNVDQILIHLLALVERVKQLILEDLITKLKEYEELFKKFLEESEDYGSEKEEVMQEAAEWAKYMTEPDQREAVSLALQKQKEDSNNSSYTLVELKIRAFKGYLKDRNKAEIGGGENDEECSLDELLDKLSEISQQVIDLKDP